MVSPSVYFQIDELTCLKKTPFLLYGRDCRYPLEASIFHVNDVETVDLAD